MKEYFLGIDTSNYTTSVAIVDNQFNVVADERQLLIVKPGTRGLRQSEAYFQHGRNLPILIEKAFKNINSSLIKAVSVSNKPRNIEESYMPVFLSGVQTGNIIANTLGIPIYENSHQEGHIEAIRQYSEIKNREEFICYHLSGGTTEILHIKNKNIKIIGGTKDIAFGQLIDRIGVKLNMDFPCGKKLDELASCYITSELKPKHIKINDLYFNISGIETYYSKEIPNFTPKEIAYSMFQSINLCLKDLVKETILKTGIKEIIFAGGVSSSTFIRNDNSNIIFGKYGPDNAVGTALIGGQKYGIKANKSKPIK